MSTAAVVIVCVVVIGLLIVIATFAAQFSKSLGAMILALSEQHKRHAQQLDTMLDRLMTKDWGDYLALREAQNPDEGAFYEPEEEMGQDEEETEILVPGPFGRRVPLPPVDEEGFA